MNQLDSFKVGLSHDLSDGNGGFSWGNIDIKSLHPLSWDFLSPVDSQFTPEALTGFHAVAFAGPSVTSSSFPKPDHSPLVLSRFGVGYDNIDLDACTAAGTALTITPDGSKKPVATAALMLTLSTMHRLVAKDALARSGGWNRRLEGLGQGLNGKTVATIGLGNIASEFFRLISPFDVRKIAYDPWKTKEEAAGFGIDLLELAEVMAVADVVVVMAQLTPESHHLIGQAQIELMKPTAVLINISRGPIIDEKALIAALKKKAIYGAGLDVFEAEPLATDNPLLTLDNVIITPHNIAWTDELAQGMGRSAFKAIKDISQGSIPEYVVNKEVLTTPQFKEKLALWQK
jgi:phosphoglycerate dehydrogenase-like enzyme